MNNKRNKKIYKKIKKKGLSINKVCEIGVYLPDTSNIIDFIFEGITTVLVEPNPPAIKAIKEYFSEQDNITLHEFAIFDREGELELSNAEASTFVAELSVSPALVNDKYTKDDSKNVTVKCVRFDSFDPGDFDLISVDTEGCEWHVLQYMKSRPKVISMETHGKFYINHYLDKITAWIKSNNYSIWYKDMSDTVYIRNDVFRLNTIDQIALLWMNLRIKTRRAKKIFYS